MITIEFVQACVMEHIRHKLGCFAVVTDFQFYLTPWKCSYTQLKTIFHHTVQNYLHLTLHFLTAGVCTNVTSVCHDIWHLTGRKYGHASLWKFMHTAFLWLFQLDLPLNEKLWMEVPVCKLGV